MLEIRNFWSDPITSNDQFFNGNSSSFYINNSVEISLRTIKSHVQIARKIMYKSQYNNLLLPSHRIFLQPDQTLRMTNIVDFRKYIVSIINSKHKYFDLLIT